MEKTFRREDLNILNLRHLYEQYGYVHYKMNKFEEYDLYVANKDFLASGHIITFTDTNGKLMALKPDVTLSIVKNYKGAAGTVDKVYYNENIYRPSKRTKTYKEIMQMGLECIGDIDIYNVCEVLILAAKSLKKLSSRYILDLSHMGVVRGLLEALALSHEDEAQFLTCLREKNAHGIRQLCREEAIDEATTERIVRLAEAYGSMNAVLEVLRGIVLNDTMAAALKELEAISGFLTAQGFTNVHLDFSIVNDMDYYNGVLFRGYIDGIPSGILSGGQYDELMEKMGKNAGAIGFAINIARIANYTNDPKEYDVDALLLYDATCTPQQVLQNLQLLQQRGQTAQAQKTVPAKLKYKTLWKLTQGGLEKIETND